MNMNKTEIFNEALLRAVRNSTSDVLSEMSGMEDDSGKLKFRNVMHEMIRQEVQNIIYEKYLHKYSDEDIADDDYDEWCDTVGIDMYDDLWKWIDNGCPFGLSDEDCIELFGFNNTNWHKI